MQRSITLIIAGKQAIGLKSFKLDGRGFFGRQVIFDISQVFDIDKPMIFKSLEIYR